MCIHEKPLFVLCDVLPTANVINGALRKSWSPTSDVGDLDLRSAHTYMTVGRSST